jgi:hypothetical protein
MDIDVLIVLLLSLILVFAVLIWMRPAVAAQTVEETPVIVRNIYPSDDLYDYWMWPRWGWGGGWHGRGWGGHGGGGWHGGGGHGGHGGHH